MKVQTKQLQNDTELTEEQTHEVTVSEEYGANAGPQGTSSDLRDSDTCSKKKKEDSANGVHVVVISRGNPGTMEIWSRI